MKNEAIRDGRGAEGSSDVATASTVREDAQHTPGPWEADFDEMAGYDCMFGAWGISPVGVRRQIAEIDLSAYGQQSCVHAFRSAEAEANARLIAAAPELLAALKVILGCEEKDDFGIKYYGFDADSDVAVAARAAIAKAEGK